MRYGKILLVIVSSLWLASPLMAQVTTSTILGTVTDQSKALIPEVRVKVTDVGTGFESVVTTDSNGTYIVENLKPGQYKVTASKAGFKEKIATGITVQVAQRARIDIQMEVGEITQTIEVQSTAPVVETDTSTVGKVITTKDVLDLPLNGRNFLQLAQLTPGVQKQNLSYMEYTGGSISANGMSNHANVPLIDGIPNFEPGAARMNFSPSIDLIQEFKIQTNSYDAEFGQSAGAQINVVTKRGTSAWHGSAFEFIRDDSMDARPFFQPGDLPPFRRNQFGGTVGGPIARSKKDFFFFSYEGLRSTQGITRVLTQPSAALKLGDFAGTGTTIYDPATLNATTGLRQAFAGNVIPADRISPQAKYFNGFMPNPQTSAFVNNFISNPNQIDRTNEYSIRYDRDFSEKDTVTVRYTWKGRYAELPLGSSGFNTPLPGFDELGNFWGQNHKIGWTRVFNPGTVNTLNLGYALYHQNRANRTAGRNYFQEAGIQGVSPATQTSGFPNLIISGWTGLNDNFVSGVDGPERSYIVNDTLSLVREKHSFKVGGGVIYARCVETFNAFTSGRVFYNPTYSTSAPNAAGNQFNSFADYLLGLPSSSSINLTRFDMDFREGWVSGFVQDNWNVSPSLTLNLGLRYEIFNRPIDAGDRYRAFDLNTQNWIYPGTVPVGQPGVHPNSKTAEELGYPRAIGQPNTYNNWGPRVGFAFRPLGNNKTVLRGGFAVFWNWTVFDMPTGMGLGAAPWNPSSSITCNSNVPCVTSASPYNTTVVPTVSGVANNNTNRTPYTFQYSLGVQHEITPTLGLDLAYVGNAGRKNLFTYPFNAAHAGPGTIASRSPYPTYGALNGIVTWGTSHYDSLQLALRKTYANGLMFLGSYTWSHALGNSISGPQIGEGLPRRDNYNWKEDTGNTTYDLRHILAVSWVYELPWGKGKPLGGNMSRAADLALGGWKFGGITSLRSGYYLTPTDAVNVSNAGGSRPDLIADPNNQSHSSRDAAIRQWFTTSAFQRAPQFTFGSSGLGVIEGPGSMSFDLSLYKRFAVAESKHLEFRAEFFNAFNRPNFGNPGTTFGTGSFGVISSTSEARSIQLGIRFDF